MEDITEKLQKMVDAIRDNNLDDEHVRLLLAEYLYMEVLNIENEPITKDWFLERLNNWHFYKDRAIKMAAALVRAEERIRR